MTTPHPHLDIAAAQRNYPGEKVCGDAVHVSTGSNRTLIAMADGLGHGPEARHAAQTFCDALTLEEESLVELLRRAHRALAGTRGVAALILRFDHDAGLLRTAGVGNVDCRAVSRSPIHAIPTAGILGQNLKRVTEHAHRTSPGDWLAVMSDGISPHVDLQAYRSFEPQVAADLIVRHHSRGNDDSSCVVIRVR